MKKDLARFLCGALFLPLTGMAQNQAQQSVQAVPAQAGVYEPTWESFAKYECPEWFRDAKFGIWAHWGPQCEPESGDWYARHMYYPNEWQHRAHVEKYGDPKEFGFKDVIHEWTAEEWDPEALVSLYKSVGARYFMALANHHDNFDLWDSRYQSWNSVNMGPKRDVVGEWAEACKKNELPLGVSIHASHAWTWMEGAQDYDGKLTLEDGKGKWWEGYDPQELYEQRHERSEGSRNVGTIHSQWEWGNGAAPMTEAYKTKFYNRTLDVIDRYHPDMIYFDDTAVPFYPVSDEGLRIVAHLYNKSMAEHDGQMRAVVMGKKLTEEQKEGMLWDVERGIPDRMQEKAWQTCTCLGQWHYDRGVYDRNGYKSAATVVKMLVDIVSKNGNLLLSVPLRGSGAVDEKETAILEGIKAWMDVNGESIYGTRPWTVFGEGPTAEASNPINNQGFNEGMNYTADDIRFVQRHDTVYATALGWPEGNRLKLKSFASVSPYHNKKIKKVELLGHEGALEYNCDREALTVSLPATKPDVIAPVLRICLTDEVSYADMEELRVIVAGKLEGVKEFTGINTGHYETGHVAELQAAYDESLAVGEQAEAGVLSAAYGKLRGVYGDFQLNAQIRGGLVQHEELTQNVTVKYLKEARHFSRSDEGVPSTTRFGVLDDPWVVTSNIRNQDNFTKGGFDGYVAWNNFTGKAVGIQKWEASLPAIENGKIYQTAVLPAGKYSVKIDVHEQVNYAPGELYTVVAPGNEMLNTSDVTKKALAYFDMSRAETGKTYQCCDFTLDGDTEVSIGWAVTLEAGDAQRSMRVSAIRLYRDGKDVSADYLDNFENIRRKDKVYKRFGVPACWQTKNFYIPQDAASGVKQGIDQYPGYNTLMMGVWNDAGKADGDLSNALLYRQVTLPAGRYFFGASYEALYQINKGYLFASKDLPVMENISNSVAYASARDAAKGDGIYGITFALTEETTLYLGWINDFKEGSSTQEFRVKEVALLRYLDSEGQWEAEEALLPENGKLVLTPREWAKVVGGTYNRDGNSEPYLAATPEMEIHLGQMDLTDLNEISVRAIITEMENEDAGFRFYLDGETEPWVVVKPVKKDGSVAQEDMLAECPAVEGVHAVRMMPYGQKAGVYSVTLNRRTDGSGGVRVEDIRQAAAGKVDVCGLNGVVMKKQVEAADALRGLPKGIYLVNGKKVVK